MNKISLIVSIAALLGVILLTVSRKQGSEQKKEVQIPKPSDSLSESNIAFINIDSLVDSYTLYNELKTALMDKQERLSKEQQNKMLSLQRKEREIQQKVEERMMTQTTAQSEMEKLAMLQQQYLGENQELELQLGEENQAMTLRVYDSISSYLKIFNADKRYDLILSSTVVGGTVLMAQDGMDITSYVLKGMNDHYLNSLKKGKTDDSKGK